MPYIERLQGPSVATVTKTASSATVITLLPFNESRGGLVLYNDSTQVCYIKFGTAATTDDWTMKMEADSVWIMPQPVYTGIITAIWAAANGSMRITEMV
jgi:hypothetical protein